MTLAPNQSYIHASKMIEAFGSFFEKVSTLSSSPTKNMEQLFQFKQLLYKNLQSPDQLSSAFEAAFSLSALPPKHITKTPVRSSKDSLDLNIHGSNTTKDSNSFNRSPKHPQSIHNSEEKLAPIQISAQEDLTGKKTLITEFISLSNFLSRIKAASHNDISKLFTLSTSYNYARVFPENQQPIFNALSLSFFEKALTMKKKGTFDKLIDLSEFKGTGIYEIFQSSEESIITQKLYDILLSEPKTYPLLLNSFKKVLLKTFADKNQRYGSKTDPMNLLDELETADAITLQPLSQLFKTTIRFLILTNEKLVDKICPYIGSPRSDDKQSLKQQITIFYNKALNTVFILYPVDKLTTELDGQKNKPKEFSSTKPPIGSEAAKVGSLATLDSYGTPISSLNDIASIEQIKADSKKFSNLAAIASLPNLELGLGKSPLNRANILSPKGDIKDVKGLSLNSLAPKGKENTPSRANQYFTYKEAGILAEKMNSSEKGAQTLNIKTMAGSLNKLDLERTTSVEGDKRNSVMKAKLKAEPSSAKENIHGLLPKNSLKRENSASSSRPVVISSVVKARFAKVNHSVNQRDQEFDRIASRHLRNEPKPFYINNEILGNLASAYQAVVDKKADSKKKSVPGSYLTMDN